MNMQVVMDQYQPIFQNLTEKNLVQSLRRQTWTRASSIVCRS